MASWYEARVGRDGHEAQTSLAVAVSPSALEEREATERRNPVHAASLSSSAGATEQAEPDGPPAAARRSSGETLRPRSTPNP